MVRALSTPAHPTRLLWVGAGTSPAAAAQLVAEEEISFAEVVSATDLDLAVSSEHEKSPSIRSAAKAGGVSFETLRRQVRGEATV